jgi:hypothetical protein
MIRVLFTGLIYLKLLFSYFQNIQLRIYDSISIVITIKKFKKISHLQFEI